VLNAADAPADQVNGTFDIGHVAGFTVTGASLQAPIDAGQSYQGLMANIVTGAFAAGGADLKLGFNEDTIVFHPVDSNASGYSAPTDDLTLDIKSTPPQPKEAFSYAWGDVHIITYDKLHYDFQAAGEFTLAKSRVPGDSFDIQMRLEPPGDSRAVTVIT